MITNELISEIKSKINDNQKQAITGGTLQGVLVDMVNGLTTTGLTFLGIISPGDPAPRNEPTNGYYLSFQASNKKPYFNGVYLHRYSLLVWTQDEQGRWKFKRVKYEDHRPASAIVIGRPLPIHYNREDGSCILKLGLDGSRTEYAVMGPTNFRYNNAGNEFKEMNILLPCFYKCITGTISFPITDNNKVFRNIEEARQYISEHKIDCGYPLSTKNYSRKDGNFVWTPQRWKRQAIFLRKYHGMKNYNPEKAATSDYRGNNNLLIRVKMTNRHLHIIEGLGSESYRKEQAVSILKKGDLPKNSYGELRAFKRYKWTYHGGFMVHACGFSDEVRYFNTTRARLSRVDK